MSTRLESDKTQRHSFFDRVPFAGKPLSNLPSPHNPINKVKISEKCPFCKSRQIFTGYWKFNYHIVFHHSNEPRKNEIILKVGSKIVESLKWVSDVARNKPSFWLFMIAVCKNLNGKSVLNTLRMMFCFRKTSRRNMLLNDKSGEGLNALSSCCGTILLSKIGTEIIVCSKCDAEFQVRRVNQWWL